MPQQHSEDELDVAIANRVVSAEILGEDAARLGPGNGTPLITLDRLAEAALPLTLDAYRHARIAGLCHEGACEIARDAARDAARQHLLELGRAEPESATESAG